MFKISAHSNISKDNPPSFLINLTRAVKRMNDCLIDECSSKVDERGGFPLLRDGQYFCWMGPSQTFSPLFSHFSITKLYYTQDPNYVSAFHG
jgi:hypothetical protein